MGFPLLQETLAALQQGTLKPEPQREEESCYAKMLTKDLGRLDMNWDAKKLERYIRGLNSWPSAFTGYKGKTLKLWRAETVDRDTEEAPGPVVEVAKDSFTVQTGKGCLRLLEVQLEGKKRMDAGSFLRGVSIQTGDVLTV
jgi:methionyl-tRNA formyltransferase